MKKIIFLILIMQLALITAWAQPKCTVVNIDEEGWQAVNFFHTNFEKLKHARYLDKNYDNARSVDMNFLRADIMASGLSSDELSSKANAIARGYILDNKRRIRGAAAKLEELIRLRGDGNNYSTFSITSSDSADLVKALEFEAAAYRTYDSLHSLFVKDNAGIFKNRYKDEVAYFLTLTDKKRSDYITDFRQGNSNMQFISRKFLRIVNTYTLVKTTWNGLPCSIIQSSPYKEDQEKEFYKLKISGPEFKKQAESALKEMGFTLKEQTWVRTEKSPAYITCMAAELVVNGNNILVKFIYDK